MGRWRAWLAAAVVVSTVAVSAPAARASGETGRLFFQQRVRVIDTRPGGAGSSTLLPVGALTVIVDPNTATGSADVVPCGSPIDSAPTHRWTEPEPVSRSVIVTSSSTCLVTDASINVIVDVVGSVAPTPVVGGLQYVPLAEPAIVFAEVVTTSRDATMPRPSSVPSTAPGIVYSVEVLPGRGTVGYAGISDCAVAPTSSDVDWRSTYRVTTAVVATPSPTDPCLYVETIATGDSDGVLLVVTALGYLSAGGPDPIRLPPTVTSAQLSVSPPGLVPITPRRVMDLRSEAKLQPDEVLELDLLDEIDVSTTAVTMNVTVTGPDEAGYLTVWPCDEAMPEASNLNFSAGQDVPNLVNVRLSDDGTVCFASSAPTWVLADLAGTYSLGDGSLSTPVAPSRILDTRLGIGQPARAKIAAGTPFTLQVAGQGGVPVSGATAVTMNVTVTAPDGNGYLTAWPCDEPQPDASNLNFGKGVDIPNLVTVKLSAIGTVCLFSTATTDVIADIAQFFSASSSSGYVDLTPARLLDTRRPIGVPVAAPALAGAPIRLEVSGRHGVPASGVTSVTMNVTVTAPAGDGYVTVWPCDETRPTASNLNFRQDHDVPNLVTVKLAADGSVCLVTSATTHLIADIAGYSTAAPVSYWGVSLQ